MLLTTYSSHSCLDNFSVYEVIFLSFAPTKRCCPFAM